MPKTCVFIIGANCVGKTTLAKELIRRHGGISRATGEAVFCADGKIALAGRYATGRKHGGVDSLSGTRGLERIVRSSLEAADCVFCEGSYMDSFGMNLTNAIFAAERQLCVLLYASADALLARNVDRNGKPPTREVMGRIVLRQRRCVNAARKWASIGVPVLMFDTGDKAVDEIADAVEARAWGL